MTTDSDTGRLAKQGVLPLILTDKFPGLLQHFSIFSILTVFYLTNTV